MPAHSAQDGLVLVTGATGFVASHVIQQLQEKGYRVRATLRSLTKDPIIVAAIKALAPTARFPIELVEADLTSPKGWDEAVAGCVGIFHIAAAVVMTSPNPERDILQPSIQGVKHVFEAARRAKTVKKIVMTSSVAAIYHAAKEGKVYTEDDWNSESTLVTAPYNYSKTQAEKWAWDFVKNLPEAEKIELETINPALILGPQLLNKEAPAQAILTRILDAQMPFIPRFGFGVVDVRDVALAHINAYERDGGGNRYVVVSGSMYMTEMAKVLAAYFPGRPLPTKSGPYWIFFLVFLFSRTLSVPFLRKSWDRCFVCDNTRSRVVLGLRYRSTTEALETSAESMRQFGLIKTQQELVAAVRTKRIVMAVSVAAIGVATAFFVRKYLL